MNYSGSAQHLSHSRQQDDDWAMAEMLNNAMLLNFFLTDHSSTTACHSDFGGIYLNSIKMGKDFFTGNARNTLYIMMNRAKI